MDSGGPSGTPPAPELFERACERAALATALDRARAGRGSVVVVEGAAGVGKTALLDVAAGLAAEGGLRVQRGRGSEIERDMPLSTLRGLFERHLLALPPARRRALLEGPARPLAQALGLGEAGQLAGARLHRATRWLVVQLAEHGPLALLVDDLHHADASSLDALAAVAQHLDDLPVALVLTRRSEDLGQNPTALEELIFAAGRPLTPQPLTPAGVGAVLRERVGHDIDDVVVALGHEATGGNPFLVVEVARAFHETAQPVDQGQVADLIAGVAQSLSAVLRVRVGRLGRDAAALARAVSVLGDCVSVTEACAVAGLTREAALMAAAALAGAGIFASDRLNSFAHPLVRAAIEADLLAAERALVEERSVAVLLGSAADPARAAVHLLRTEPRGDPRAVKALRAAAASVMAAAAPQRAVVLLRRALAEGPGSPDERELFGELVAAELCAGEYAAAAGHLRTRLQRPGTEKERVADVKRLSRAVMQIDGVAAALAVLEAGLADERGEGRLVLEAERLWLSVLDPRCTAAVADCLERYPDLGDKGVGAGEGRQAMLAALAVRLSLGSARSDAAGPLFERAFGDGRLLGDEAPESPLLALAAYAMIVTDRLLGAEAEMTRALASASAGGSAGGVAMALTLRGMARMRLGLIREAEADGLAACGVAGATTGMLRAVSFAAAVGVAVDARAERGDDAGASALLAEHGLDGDLGGPARLPALLPRARAHLAAGRAAEALADATRAAAAFEQHPALALEAAALVSLASTTLGERSTAIASARAQLLRARAGRAPSAIALALRVLGLAHGDAAGVAMLEEAIVILECSPATLERAHCLVALGMLWRRTGHRSRAIATLRDGADLAQRIDAGVLAERARQHLLVLGTRPRRLAFTGADALTASERRAAMLAASGRTNREIAQELYLSVKTVESHLGRGFRKLGISSRTQLAGALGRPPR